MKKISSQIEQSSLSLTRELKNYRKTLKNEKKNLESLNSSRRVHFIVIAFFVVLFGGTGGFLISKSGYFSGVHPIDWGAYNLSMGSALGLGITCASISGVLMMIVFPERYTAFQQQKQQIQLKQQSLQAQIAAAKKKIKEATQREAQAERAAQKAKELASDSTQQNPVKKIDNAKAILIKKVEEKQLPDGPELVQSLSDEELIVFLKEVSCGGHESNFKQQVITFVIQSMYPKARNELIKYINGIHDIILDENGNRDPKIEKFLQELVKAAPEKILFKSSWYDKIEDAHFIWTQLQLKGKISSVSTMLRVVRIQEVNSMEAFQFLINKTNYAALSTYVAMQTKTRVKSPTLEGIVRAIHQKKPFLIPRSLFNEVIEA